MSDADQGKSLNSKEKVREFPLASVLQAGCRKFDPYNAHFIRSLPSQALTPDRRFRLKLLRGIAAGRQNCDYLLVS